MGILVSCPGCGRTLDAPPEAAGRAVKCTACGREFTLPGGPVPGQGPPGQAPPGSEAGQMSPGQAPPGYGPGQAAGYQPLYGDEIYDPGFNLQTVDPALLGYWRSWRPTQFSVAGAVLLDIVTCFHLFGLIYYGMKFDDLPKASRNDFGGGKGVGFMLIPFFNFYWTFRFWLGLCDRLNLQLRLRGLHGFLVSRGLTMAVCILYASSIVLSCLSLLPYAICREILIAKIQGAINAMATTGSPPVVGLPSPSPAQ